MMLPLLVGGMAAFAYHVNREMLLQYSIQDGIRQRAGYYPNGCPPVLLGPGPIVICGHNYCQMLRNAER